MNDKLSDLKPITRLLFIGLWCIADREGRMDDIPKKIKAQLFPYENLHIDKHLQFLADSGFILRYQILDGKYIQVINFKKHQYPHIKENASTIPEPDKHHTKTVLKRLNPESPLPITESPIPILAAGAAPDSKASPLSNGEYKIETPLQKCVAGWKIITGYKKDDREWDKLNWTRTAKTAKKLLDFISPGDHHLVVDCMQDIYEDLTKKGLSVTIETVAKHAAEWKVKREQKV